MNRFDVIHKYGHPDALVACFITVDLERRSIRAFAASTLGIQAKENGGVIAAHCTEC